VDFSEKVLVLKSATPITSEIVIRWGTFINNIIDFLIVAIVIFLTIKQINRFKTKEKQEEKPKGPSETELLTEIRDLLKK
jgi:large conductance mechanosensitive channel